MRSREVCPTLVISRRSRCPWTVRKSRKRVQAGVAETRSQMHSHDVPVVLVCRGPQFVLDVWQVDVVDEVLYGHGGLRDQRARV
jgi:hypothetical protein